MDAAISIDPVTIQNMGIRTTVLTNGPLRRVIRTVGTVDYDETALADVTTKFKGWVEKLYVDATGAQVHRGDPLFEVYSPELYSAQTEYLLALQCHLPEIRSVKALLSETARTKLKFLDISDAQIEELTRTREPQKTLQVHAPMDGFVVEKMVVEGQMVEAGMKLYRLADLGLVWVHAQIYEQDLPFIRLGQEAAVSLSYLPDRKFRGRVTYIYPNLDPKTRTAQVRMEFHNPGYFLKPGMFAVGGTHLRTLALRAAGAGHGRSAQRREEHRLRGARWRNVRAAHRDTGVSRGGRHVAGSERADRWRAGGDVGPVHARFRKPASRGHSEDAESASAWVGSR